MPPGLVLYIFVPREVGTRAALVVMINFRIYLVRAPAHISRKCSSGLEINKLTQWAGEYPRERLESVSSWAGAAIAGTAE